MSSDQCQPGSNRLLAMAKSPSRTILNSPWGKVRVSSGVATFFRCSVAMTPTPFLIAPVPDLPRSGRHHLHLDVFPAHIPLELLGQGIELCPSSRLEPGVTNSSEHDVLLSLQQSTTIVRPAARY